METHYEASRRPFDLLDAMDRLPAEPNNNGFYNIMPCDPHTIPAGITGRAGDVLDAFAPRCASDQANHAYLVP